VIIRDRGLIVAALRAAPTLVRGLVSGANEQQAWTGPGGDEWSIGEIAHHLLVGERDTFLPRLQRMVREQRPVFDTRSPAAPARDLAAIVAAFETARRSAVEILGGLGAADWLREGVSPSRGPLTIEAYARTMAEHDTEHLRQMQAVRATLGLLPRRCEARQPLPVPALVEALRATPSRIEHIVEGLDGDELRRRPKDGEWCIKEVMAHLRDLETRLFFPRLQRMAAEERPAFGSFDPEAWARERDHREGRLEDDLATFRRARAATIAFLEALPPGAAERLGLSAYFGPVTLAQYATHVVDHDTEHLAQMADCRVVALEQPRG
jgi:uncharacterized damage-inducible protein DinB